MEWLKEVRITDWIQIVIALIALFSTGAALATARQGKKSLELSKQQRQDTIRPKIIIKESAYWMRIKSGQLGNYYTEDLLQERVEIPIKNIGLHYATDININWNINQDKIIDFIQKNQTDSKFIDYYKDQQLFIPESSVHFYNKPFKSAISYLEVNKILMVEVPYEFIFLMRCLFFLILDKNLTPEEYIEYTSFIMEVSYKNILGDTINKEIFDIEMKIEVETNEIADGRLDNAEGKVIFRNSSDNH
ncbi:hypothetical protein [Cytobacillus kochii]|uniref:Uncharacterized protein n=1 Tax=Cytobacillus kochii TaxID=859143 RepID=A0A248TQ20_9BACI|nr:hypothetical protein [Cytobacillus kochii]ASV70240.1 hypothetical protein CKF48_23465 [Cytobacillus kochii]